MTFPVPAGFLANLPDSLFPDTVTFQESPDGGNYANVTGLVNLEARLIHSPPGTDFMQQRSEMNYDFNLQRGASHKCLLRGIYTTVASGQRMVCNGAYYQVLSIKHKSGTMTVVTLSGTQAVV